MGTEHLNVVADAGPLIHLTEIAGLQFLTLFETVVITEHVWRETIAHSPIFSATIAEFDNVERTTVAQADFLQFVRTHQLEHLHQGESECFYVCRQRGIAVILTDDLAARDAAKRLQLTPVGSLGVIVNAYRNRMISLTDAERLISALYEVSSLFVTKTIVEMVLEQLRRG